MCEQTSTPATARRLPVNMRCYGQQNSLQWAESFWLAIRLPDRAGAKNRSSGEPDKKRQIFLAVMKTIPIEATPPPIMAYNNASTEADSGVTLAAT